MNLPTLSELPDDISALKCLLIEYIEQMQRAQSIVQNNSEKIEQLEKTLDKKSRQIANLEEVIRYLKFKHYGKSSERHVAPGQQNLFNEAEYAEDHAAGEQAEAMSSEEGSLGDETTVAQNTSPKKKRGRRKLPDHLPRKKIYHDLPADEKRCGCGCELKIIDEVTSEQLAVIPAEMYVIQHCRKKYVCPACPEAAPKTAALPAQALPKSNASPLLLAHIAVSKFLDGLPFYRQEKIWERVNVCLSRATQANWMIGSGNLVQPLINLLIEQQMQSDVMHLDETPVQVLNEPDKPPDGKKYFWVAVGGPPDKPIYRFHYDPSRGSSVAYELLQGFKGGVMTDDWLVYAKVCAALNLTHLACNDHARRKFKDAFNDLPKDKRGHGSTSRPQTALNFYSKLYAVERRIKQLPAEEKYQQRQQHSVPVWNSFIAWIEKQIQHVTPQSTLGKALHYTYKLRDKLRYYCTDGALPMSNEKAENAIRPFAIARKNFLFYDSPKGAQASANLYSLIMTAKSHNLNPFYYLAYVFKELPLAKTLEDIEALLPWAVTEEQISACVE